MSMFSFSKLECKGEYKSFTKEFREFFKLVVFFEREIYGKYKIDIPYAITSAITKHLGINSYYSFSKSNTHTEHFLTANSEKFISYFESEDFYLWNWAIHAVPNKDVLHEIRKAAANEAHSLYKVLSEAFDEVWTSLGAKAYQRNCNYLFISDILMRLYSNIPCNIDFDESLLLQYIHADCYKDIERDFVSLGLDRTMILNMEDRNLRLLYRILTWFAKTGNDVKTSEALKWIETNLITKDSSYLLNNYFRDGLTDLNSEEPLVKIFESFFTGQFENAFDILKEYRKSYKKMIGFDVNSELFCILQVCRAMLLKELNNLERDISAELKRQENWPIQTIIDQIDFFADVQLGKIRQYKSDFNEIMCEIAKSNCSCIVKILPLAVAKLNDYTFSNSVINAFNDTLKNIKECYPYLAKCLYPTIATGLGSELDVFLQNSTFFNFSQARLDSLWQSKLNAIKDILKIDKNAVKSSKVKGKPAKVKDEKHIAWVFSKDENLWYPTCCVITGANFDTPEEHMDVHTTSYAIKNFYSGKSSTHAYVSEKDQSIALSYKRVEYYGSKTCYYTFSYDSTIQAMIGHPYIYCLNNTQRFLSENMVHMKVQECKPELKVVEEKTHIKAKMNIGEFVFEKVGVTFDLDKRIISVYPLEKCHSQIYELLDSKAGYKFPKDTLQELISLGKSSNLSVNLDIKSDKVKSNCIPVMKLDAGGKILSAKLRFKCNEDPMCPLKTPGLGEASLYFKSQNSQLPIVVERDLQKEQDIAQRIINNLSALDNFVNEGDFTYSTVNLEELLKLLQELKARENEADIPEIMWANNKKHNIFGTISNSNFGIKADITTDDYLSISGNVNLSEDHYLSLKSLLAFVKESKGNFIKIDDENYVAVTGEIKSRLEKLNALIIPGKKKDELRAHPLAEKAIESVLGDMGCEFSSKINSLIKKRDEAMNMKVSFPKTLHADLRSYQRDGFTWLYRLSQWGVGACLADDMGLGKTIQTIAVMLKLASEGPIVVVAPTSVCPNWQLEIQKFAPSLVVKRLKEADNRSDMVSSMKVGEVLIVSYGLFAIESDILSDIKWRLAIFDEAQALKNADTQRAKTATRINADMRIALTGTPIENSLDDLWSIFNIINPGLLGTNQDFHTRFAGIENNHNTSRMLKLLISPFILRRLKGEVLDDLPPRTEQIIYVESSEREKAIYETMRLETIEELEKNKLSNAKGGQRRFQILSALTKLRQLCCDPALLGKELNSGVSAKTQAFEDLLDEALSGGHRLLVFSQFVGYLSRIREILDRKKIEYKYLDGQTPERARAKAIEEFQTGIGDVFLISLKAGGQGLNLTGADYVVHLDPWWNPAVEDQATDRAYRIGQTRPVNVFRFAIKDSIEQKILELHAQKRELAADFLEGTASAANEAMKLSEEELLALIG